MSARFARQRHARAPSVLLQLQPMTRYPAIYLEFASHSSSCWVGCVFDLRWCITITQLLHASSATVLLEQGQCFIQSNFSLN